MRRTLQTTKGKLKGAQKGHDLLKKKADALAMRFRSILRNIKKVRPLPLSLLLPLSPHFLLFNRTRKPWETA